MIVTPPAKVAVDLDNPHREAVTRFLDLSGLEGRQGDPRFLSRVAGAFSRLPYENITKILRYHARGDWESRLRMPEAIMEEHLTWGAGGTCFSLTYFLKQILAHLGYRARIAMADTPSGPDLHCALVVQAGASRLLVDPGYLIATPLPIPDRGDALAQAGAYTIRIRATGAGCAVSTLGASGEKHRYTLKPAPVTGEAFLAHWQDSFRLPLLNGILVTAVDQATHLYLHNNHFRATDARRVASETVRKGYGARIEEIFGISADLAEKARDLLKATGKSKIKGPA